MDSFFHLFAHLSWKTTESQKKFYTGKVFDFEIFGLKCVLKHSKWIPTKKLFDQNFLTLPFFHYFGHFGQKMTKSQKKFMQWEKFSILRVPFQNTFQSILNRFRPKKIFRPKFFELVISSLFWWFWPKKTKSHEKNFTREKIFNFEIFVLKYFLKHSESILTKKIDQISLVCHF